MRKSVTKWSLALAVSTALAGPAAGHDKAPATVSPFLTVPQIVPALATRANVPTIAPVVPQQAVTPAMPRFGSDVGGPAVRHVELPRFEATPRMVDISRSGGRSGHDGRAALEAGATNQVTAKSEASATAATTDTSTRSDTKVAANVNTETAAEAHPLASRAAPAPAPSCH